MSEGKCGLKGVSDKNFLIFNGDNLEEFKKKSQINKTVDCIIISRKSSKNGHAIVLCELTGGKKSFFDIVEKFQKSGNEIIRVFNSFDLRISRIDCVFLAKL